MELSRRLDRVAPIAAFVAAVVLSFVGLSSSGIWDPWEIDVAERARLGEPPTDRPALADTLVRVGFRALGPSEWSGRLPVAIAGLAIVALAMALARRTTDRRGVAYAAIVAASTPLFLANARSMVGDAGAMAAQAIVGFLALECAFPRGAHGARRVASLALLPVAAAIAIAFRGALLGVLPPLLGVSLVLCLEGRVRPTRTPRPVFESLVVAATLGLTAYVVAAVLADRAEYRWALGGVPRGGTPPTFESGLAMLFHAFAPWSPLAILAAGKALASRGAAEEETDDRTVYELVLVAWAAFAYAASTAFSSRYGAASFLALAPLGALVGSYARKVEREATADRTSFLVAALLTGLLIRDFALYPRGPVEGLPIVGLATPDTFHATIGWAAVLLAFVVALFFAYASSPVDASEPPEPLRARIDRFRTSLPKAATRALTAAAVLLALLSIASIAALVAGERLGLPTIAVRILRAFLPLEVALVVAAVATPITLRFVGRYAAMRFAPVMLAGLAAGAYVAFGYLPALGEDLSPRDAYDTYNELRSPSDRLVLHRVGSRAAPYYARGGVQSVDEQPLLLAHLSSEGRRWAVVPRDSFTAIDHAYRELRGSHLVVADAQSSRVLLVTNAKVPGRRDENPIATAVSTRAPHPRFPVSARFGDAIELVGYDLELPHDGYVGAGEKYHVTWHFHATARPPAGYTVFLHVDGFGLRANGDHVPVDGLVPLGEWSPGDYVADRQELSIPSNFRSGEYTMFLGFFAGEHRLPVTLGANDGSNRLAAGRILVR